MTINEVFTAAGIKVGDKLTAYSIGSMLATTACGKLTIRAITEGRYWFSEGKGRKRYGYREDGTTVRETLFFRGWELPIKSDSEAARNGGQYSGNACYNFVGESPDFVRDWIKANNINPDFARWDAVLFQPGDVPLYPDVSTTHAVVKRARQAAGLMPPEPPKPQKPPQERLTAEDIRANLPYFTGTEDWYKCMGLNLTDGTKFIAEAAGAMWLMTDIAGAQLHPKVAPLDFQLWELSTHPTGNNGDKAAVLTCRADKGEPVVYTQKYDRTDFPLDEGIKLYCRDKVLFLPSEY